MAQSKEIADTADLYFNEILIQLARANEPLRLAYILFSMVDKLDKDVPAEVLVYLRGNKALCDKLDEMASMAGKPNGLLN